MSRMIETITVDGCIYTVTVTHDGDVISVTDAEGNYIADAERDHACEAVYFGYFDDDGLAESGSTSDLFRADAETIASWLVSTHPCN